MLADFAAVAFEAVDVGVSVKVRDLTQDNQGLRRKTQGSALNHSQESPLILLKSGMK